VQGIEGVQGPQGIQGVQGERGIQGIQGQTGIQGIVGPIGLTGPTYEEITAIPGAAGTVTLDLSGNTYYKITLAGNTTFAFSGTLSNARTYSSVIEIKQSATSSFSVTWPSVCLTQNDAVYTMSTPNNAVDLYTVFTGDAGATILLTLIGKNYR
jgi:hypothetical protein